VVLWVMMSCSVVGGYIESHSPNLQCCKNLKSYRSGQLSLGGQTIFCATVNFTYSDFWK
jgi:hypothetical protein